MRQYGAFLAIQLTAAVGRMSESGRTTITTTRQQMIFHGGHDVKVYRERVFSKENSALESANYVLVLNLTGSV